jgi:uncharacterized repeat protein (TIGR01451 family)
VAAAGTAAALLVLTPAIAAAATADLGVDLSDSPDPVTAGDQLGYAIEVTNAGPDSATGVEVVDDLPSRIDLVSSTSSQGSCERHGRQVRCALGTVDAGASATITIGVDTRKAGSLVNTATVSTADTDPQDGNDRDTETTTVSAPPPVPTCGGRKATIVGRDSSDAIVGTEKRDVIVALGGDDLIVGLGGNDLICAGTGDDIVRGKAGADLVRTGGGSDRLKGGSDADALRAGGGDDRLSGGPGGDLLRGGSGTDSCRGGPGHDTKRSC